MDNLEDALSILTNKVKRRNYIDMDHVNLITQTCNKIERRLVENGVFETLSYAYSFENTPVFIYWEKFTQSGKFKLVYNFGDGENRPILEASSLDRMKIRQDALLEMIKRGPQE